MPDPTKTVASGVVQRRSGRDSKLKARPRSRFRPVILMVEDNPDDREIYGSVLVYNGFNVLLVEDATTAIWTLGIYRPELILLDLGLPDRNGLEICEWLRQSEGLPIPVVVLSGFSEIEMGWRAREAGCSHYLQKPANPVDLLHIVEEIVGRAPPAGDGPPPRLIELPSDARSRDDLVPP